MQNYEIYIDNGSGEKLFYRAGIPELMLLNIKYKPVAGSAGSLEFTVPFKHPSFNEIEPLNTDFWLYKNKQKIFRGRYIGNKEDFYRSGSITCEGDLNFLVDSMQDPYEFTGGIKGFVDKMIAVHNARTESRKHFTVGTISVTDVNDYLNRKNSNYSTTAEALKNKLVESYGGYFRTRYVGKTTYLDYVYNMGTCSQVIRFGENLLDIEKVIDPTSIITCLVPLGAEIEANADKDGAAKRVDISSVNGGKKYIENAEGIKKWGYIWGTQTWDNVTLPQNLLTKAKEYLAKQISLPATITLTAVDLSLIQANVDDFEVGQWIKVESKFHGLKASDGGYILEQATIDISDPSKSTITLGGKKTSISMATARSIEDVIEDLGDIRDSTSSEIQKRVKNTSDLITGGNGGYVKIHFADETDPKADHHPDEILIMDTDNINTAKKVIRINRNGIGFSDQGYNPQKFATAWAIDSTFYANFITAGTMLADRIRGGLLEVGGTGLGKNGSISVKDTANAEKVLMNTNGITINGGSINIGANNWDANGINIKQGAINLPNGVWDKDGFRLTSGTIAGTTISGSTIKGNAISGGTVSGTTITGTNINGNSINGGTITGAAITATRNNTSFITLDSNGLNIDKVLKTDLTGQNPMLHFYGEVFRVYETAQKRGRYSSVVNNSQRVWNSGGGDVLSYVGEGGNWVCGNNGSKDNGILYLTGEKPEIHLAGEKADIYLNGRSVAEALGWKK